MFDTIINDVAKRTKIMFPLSALSLGSVGAGMGEHPRKGAAMPKGNRFVDLTGQKFGRWLVIREHEKRAKDRAIRWVCKCSCPLKTVRVVSGTNLRSGHSKSCGCYKKERIIETSTKHGMYKSTEYTIWEDVKQRCTNPKHISYKYYGALGIKMCDRWMNSFRDFFEDMGNRPTLQHSIDRIDNDGNYEPGNCRWATLATQNNNRRDNIIIGQLTMAQYCTKHRLDYHSFRHFYRRRKETLEDATRMATRCRNV